MSRGKDILVLRNLIYSLVLFGQIRTTRTRAKAVQGLIDRLINKTKKGTVAAMREVLQILPEKPVVEKLSEEIIPGLGERNSGYTRILRIGRRPGDGAAMVLLQWVAKPLAAVETNKAEETKVEKVAKAARKRNAKTDKTK